MKNLLFKQSVVRMQMQNKTFVYRQKRSIAFANLRV